VEARNQIVTKLYDCYMANGFITEDEALSLFASHNTPLHLIDSITEQILAMGIIILADDDEAEQFIDRSKSDYETYFNEVITLAPNAKPLIDYIRNIIPPQTREWQKLMPQAQNGNEYARNRLFEMYMRIVIRQALYYSKKYRLSLEDTIQDGMMGLMTSIDKFNPAEHMSFATYLPWWITQSIARNRRLHCNPMYFPVHMSEKLFGIMRDVEEHTCERCSKYEQVVCPNIVEFVKDKNDWTAEEAQKNIHYLICYQSLDEMLEKGADICDDEPFFKEDSDINQNVSETLKTLPKRERDVLLYRFGFTDNGEMTLEEVGNLFGVTRERIRQIEAKALRRLRRPSRSSKFK